MHANKGQLAIRRIQGLLSLVAKYGIARVEEACTTALEMEVCDYRFVRRYLETGPASAEFAAGRSAHPPTHSVPRPYPSKEPRSPMNEHLIELQRALRQLRLGGMAAVLETRLRQAQAEPMAPIDLISLPDFGRTHTPLATACSNAAANRPVSAIPTRTLDNFDFTFNPKMNRSLIFDLATGSFIAKREDALFLGPGGTGKSHLAQAIGHAAILQGYRVLYRETHVLLEELAEAVADGTRKQYMESSDDRIVADHRRLRYA